MFCKFRRIFRRVSAAVALLLLLDQASDVACRLCVGEPESVPSAPGRYAPSVVSHQANPVFSSRQATAPAEAGRSDRLEKHRAAARFLTELNLFRNGRGMHAAPGAEFYYDRLARDAGWKGLLSRRWMSGSLGLHFDESRQAVGFHRREAADTTLIVQGCAVCHNGRVLGCTVPGLGNKNIDPFELGYLGKSHAEAVGKPSEFCSRVADPRLGNLTQGMVPVAVVYSWFYRQVGLEPPADMARAAVKVPALWGYGEKRRVGQFCDGIGDGRFAGWAAAVELVGGQHPDTIRQYADELETIERTFGDLLSPAYPLEIDLGRAQRGRRLFQAHCAECHGTYEKDADLLPRYQPPLHVAWNEVGTDEDRLRNNTAAFLETAAGNPLSEILRINPDYSRGYFAPRLEGIWARYPYLHNGSVPNIATLLTAVTERPAAFDLSDAGEVSRFDASRLGLTVPPDGSEAAAELVRRGRDGDRRVFLVERVGHSNQGHEFGVRFADDEKQDLIEYLKVL
jgi:hypothetical protein